MTAASWLAAMGTGLMSRRVARMRWRRFLRETSGAVSRRDRGRVPTLLIGPRRTAAAVGLAAGAVALVVGGPVAALLSATYGGLGTGLALRRAIRRAEVRSRRAAVDTVAALAAELRAGLPVGAALVAAAGSLEGPGVVGKDAVAVARRVVTAVRLAETSGAPLADVLDRLDGHLRAVDRARGVATAQAAGAKASAALLAAMPAAGPGLCLLIGVDPVHALLHTVLGGGCVVAALVLQLGGLAWSARLSTVDVPA
jgi:tight adherence protein B